MFRPNKNMRAEDCLFLECWRDDLFELVVFSNSVTAFIKGSSVRWITLEIGRVFRKHLEWRLPGIVEMGGCGDQCIGATLHLFEVWINLSMAIKVAISAHTPKVAQWVLVAATVRLWWKTGVGWNS